MSTSAPARRDDGPPPTPLTDEEAAAIVNRMSKLSTADINEICDGYSQCIKGLISYAVKKMDPNKDEDEIVELERTMRIVNLCPKDDLFVRSKDKIWHARYHILDKDDAWFLNRDYSNLIKKDQKQKTIETIIRIIKRFWTSLSAAEKESYWEKAFGMLRLVGKFKKLTGET